MVMVWPVSKSRSMLQPQLLLFLYTTGCFILSMSRPALVDAAAPFSFSFDFSNTSTYRLDDLRFEGDAVLNGDLVDLTCKTPVQTTGNNCTGIGRMSYNHPVRFYDTTTGEVASFSTRFTFAIKPNKGRDGQGNGMAFFLASYPSRLPLGSGACNLGLDDGKTALGVHQFVAIEFDTCNNTWDPMGKDQIGIDINTIRSCANTTSLPSSSLNGTMTATISFDSTTKMLIASLRFEDLPSLGPVQVSTQLRDNVTSLLPSEVTVGFSAATGISSNLHQIISWSFSSTLDKPQKTIGSTAETPKQRRALGGGGTHNPQQQQGSPANKVQRVLLLGTNGTAETPGANNTQQQHGPPAPSDKGGDTGAVITRGAIVLVTVVPIVWFILSWLMWKRKANSFVRKAGLGEFRRFDYNDLVKATGNFSTENRLGEGSFGVVHKGILKKHDGSQDKLAVKRIKESILGVGDTFVSELKATCGTGHKNLVKLKGWCYCRINWKLFDFIFCREHKTDVFLVYELVPNGSLHDHLNGERTVLSWENRYEIVKGIGSGLCYLHYDCKPYILHRDIKQQNILLDDDFNPKLADFGLSRIANQNNTIASTRAVGTEGYIDPLCRKDGNVKFDSSYDVYSFGVVLLDITCPQKTTEQVREMYRRSGLEKFLKDAADIKLHGAFDMMQMNQVVVLGLWCCFPDATKRPSMKDAVKLLENDAPLLKKGMQILEHGRELPDEQIIEESGGNASSMTSPDGQVWPLIPSSTYKRSV